MLGALRRFMLGQKNGVAPLDASALVPIANLPTGSSASTVTIGNDGRLLTTTEQQGSLWGGPQGPLGSSVNVATTSDTAYWIYVGRVPRAFTPAYANFSVGSAGSGAQTAEIGFFSTPASPNGANQTVTKIVSTGSISSLTSTGVKRNSSAFTTEIAAGTYLWIGIRTAMATTQPGCNYCSRDWARGTLLATATAGALTNAGPWTGSVIAWSSSSNEAPAAWWSMQ